MRTVQRSIPSPATLVVKRRRPILGEIIDGALRPSPLGAAVARAVREAGLPLIAIVPHGFGPYFKPSGEYFDACAAGKLRT